MSNQMELFQASVNTMYVPDLDNTEPFYNHCIQIGKLT